MKTQLSRKYAFKIAKQELNQWKGSIPRSLLMAILFCYIHRLLEGESFEETFHSKQTTSIDYQI